MRLPEEARVIHKVLPSPEYEYPTTDANKDTLRDLVMGTLQTLDAKFGPPHMLDRGPSSWQNVMFRILHPEIPDELWGSGSEVRVIVPWDVLGVGLRLARGQFPPWLAVEVKAPPPSGMGGPGYRAPNPFPN